MTTLFGLCAVIGGTVLVCQFVLTIMGLGDGGDDLETDVGNVDFAEADVTDLADDLPEDVSEGAADSPADGQARAGSHVTSGFFKIVTFRTVIAALTFFGLAGLAAGSSGATAPKALGIALASGLAAMFAIHWVMQQFYELRTDGTVNLDDAIGGQATVYLRIPGQNSGAGKVHMNLYDRTVELQARTLQAGLSSGDTVVIVRVLGPDMVEVERVSYSQEVPHA